MARKSRFIECFHSRGQHLCKFMGTKKSVYIRKEFNSHRIGLGHQHGRRFIVLGHVAAVTSLGVVGMLNKGELFLESRISSCLNLKKILVRFKNLTERYWLKYG